MVGLLTDRVALDEYMGVWFRFEVSEAVEVMRLKRDQEDDVSLLGLLDTFVHRMYEIVPGNASLQMQAAHACCKCLLANACLQMLACKCLLENACLKMLACKCKLHMQAANSCLQMLACKCKLYMQAANACFQMLACKCLLINASCKCRLQMLAANASCICRLQMLACKCLLQMQAAYAGCKCLLINACLQMLACKCLLANAKASCKFKVQILDENAGYKCFTEYIIP
ncbi:hypothetical protein Tco_1187709 [Tanacetum coccineum]